MTIFLLIINFLSIICSQYVLIKTTGLITKSQRNLRRQVIGIILIVLMYVLFGLFAATPLLVGLLSFALNVASIGLIVYVFKRKNQCREVRFQLWFAASFNVVFYYGLSYMGDVILTLMPKGHNLFLSYASLMTLIMQVGFYFILKRFNPYGLLQSITTNVVVKMLIGAVVFINMLIISLSQFLISKEIYQWENNQVGGGTVTKLNYFVLIFLVDVVISGLLIGVSSYVLFEVKKRQLQENIVLQQNFYIQNLEKMQLDMRVMRHDYKNILSGLIIQAQEGNMQGIQDYLKTTVNKFDMQIGKSLQQTTHLSKIEITELKGLLLMKLAEMERLNIDCQIEIVTPVKAIQMETTDLIRCVGILLDNAMEEIATSLSKELKIIISQEKQDVSFIIKNAISERPLVQKIWEEGYSTKGQGRGLGLFSYQRIVEKYPNVLKETVCEEQEFTQILKIKDLAI